MLSPNTTEYTKYNEKKLSVKVNLLSKGTENEQTQTASNKVRIFIGESWKKILFYFLFLPSLDVFGRKKEKNSQFEEFFFHLEHRDWIFYDPA